MQRDQGTPIEPLLLGVRYQGAGSDFFAALAMIFHSRAEPYDYRHGDAQREYDVYSYVKVTGKKCSDQDCINYSGDT